MADRSVSEIVAQVKERFAQGVVELGQDNIVVRSESLPAIASFLKETPGLDFDFLSSITGVDYGSYFELVYRLVSLKHNHNLVLKVRCQRDEPVVPSLVGLWLGADFQEREIFDLMGIKFEGHPNLKRIVLWEGFKGHPQRKDYQHDA